MDGYKNNVESRVSPPHLPCRSSLTRVHSPAAPRVLARRPAHILVAEVAPVYMHCIALLPQKPLWHNPSQFGMIGIALLARTCYAKTI
jgi:hypothetical protein